ncbi:MAG: DEAD/DEAH box helicase [Candidatus Kapaibacteriota bacterium]|jgi:ATP-dependent RNA helicase RhlE
MNFTDLPLSEALQKALKAEGYSVPTPIQAEAIPSILQGSDIIGCAQTGTGKTAAFALPILELLASEPIINKEDRQDNKHKGRKKPIRALILSPTRELAQQIGDSFTAYGKFTGMTNTVIYGGVAQSKQQQALRNGVDILVATPGRLLDLMNQRIVSLSSVSIVVLDEADHMLDMGFIHDIRSIIDTLPSKRQSLLFSATMPQEIERLANDMLNNAKRIAVDPVSSSAKPVEQLVYFVDRKKKIDLLLRLMDTLPMTSVLVFSRTKHGADRIARDLNKEGVPSEVIHGDKTQSSRLRALNRFKEKRSRVLVATDIAARGIDVEQLPYVVNYDLPDAAETYVHRIGRTGRAGLTGVAISFCSNDQQDVFRQIKKIVGKDTIKSMSVEEAFKKTPQFQAGEHPYPSQKKEKPQSEEQKGLSKAGHSVQSILKGHSPKKHDRSPDIERLLEKDYEPKNIQEAIAARLKAEGVSQDIILRTTGIHKDIFHKL